MIEATRIPMFLLQCLVAGYLVGGLLLIASGISNRLFAMDSMSVRWCGTFVTGLWIASVGFHILAFTGLFKVWHLVSALTFLLVVVRATGYTWAVFSDSLRRDAAELKQFLRLSTTHWEKVLLLLLGIAALLVSARTLILPPLSWDALTYHAVKAGMWVQNGHWWLMEAPGGWFNYRSYPGGGEVFYALAMLPFHSDFVAPLADFVQWLALIPALFMLGMCVGLQRKSCLVAAIFCAFMPAVVFSVGSCYVDIVYVLSLILGVAFLARYTLLGRSNYLIFGLMALGVAGSVKYLAYIPLCAVLALITIRIAFRGRESKRNFLTLGLALVVMLAPMIPWLIYNTCSTGYPLFPFSAKVAGVQLGVSSPVTDWYVQRSEVQPYVLGVEMRALLRLFDWPRSPIPNYGLPGLVVCCVFPIAMVSLLKRRVWVGLLLAAVVLSAVGTYFLPGFTVVRQIWADSNARFLFSAILPIAVISLLAFRGRIGKLYLASLLIASGVSVLVGIWTDWKPFECKYMALASILVTVALGGAFTLCKGTASTTHVIGGIIVLLACLMGISHIRTQIRPEAMRESYFFHDLPRYWTKAAASVDEPSASRRIAMTSGPFQTADNWFMYPFMGRRLQNTIHYVPATESGQIGHFGPNYERLDWCSYEVWLNRIRLQGITDVVSFSPRSREIQWMLDHPETFERITGNDEHGLFRVKGAH